MEKTTGNVDLPSRVAELEGELSAAQRTIDVLLDRIDGPARALVESEAQLREKNAELERQGTAKAEFISIVAHELRTPLTSIVGYLELLTDQRFGEVPQLMLRPLTSIQRNAHRLTRLVDEMLDVTRIETGRMVFRPVKLDLGDVVREAVTELESLATIKRQALIITAEGKHLLEGDRDKLHRVVVNLVANAIRYTPTGGTIEVTVMPVPLSQYPGGWLRLLVRDNGVGLTEKQRHRIFEPFTTRGIAKHHSSMEPGSSGLGLHITRGLVELHGGLITVDSDPGIFTEFSVLLPPGSPSENEKTPSTPSL